MTDFMERGCAIELIDGSWPRLAELEQLIYDVLYQDFGVAITDAWRQPVGGTRIAVALIDGDIAGTAALVGGVGEPRLQLRQVAVVPGFRQLGIGRVLVEELERIAATGGTREIWLNARDEAFGFYQRLGYEYTGSVFVSELTGISHRPMRKLLG